MTEQEKRDRFEDLADTLGMTEFEKIAAWELMSQVEDVNYSAVSPEQEAVFIEIGRLVGDRLLGLS